MLAGDMMDNGRLFMPDAEYVTSISALQEY